MIWPCLKLRIIVGLEPLFHRDFIEVQNMDDLTHPTNKDWQLFDPKINPPPKDKSLLVINEGGVLIISMWYEGALAWGFKPKIPKSVKERLSNVRFSTS
jgi:hypothetical protein